MTYKKPKAEYDLIFPAIRKAVNSKRFNSVDPSVHREIQEVFKTHLKDFGATVRLEERAPYNVGGIEYFGRIDLVVGFYGNRWAIEIDRRANPASLIKLKKFQSEFKVQFFYTANISPYLSDGVYIIGKNMISDGSHDSNKRAIFRKLRLKKRQSLYGQEVVMAEKQLLNQWHSKRHSLYR